MTSKIDHFITRVELSDPTIPVPYHDTAREAREIGPARRYMESSLVPEADICISVREVNQVPPDYKPHLEPHKHEVSKVYAVMGDLTVEFMLEGEKREVKAPAALFIPAGMTHSWCPLRGSGSLLVVLRKGEWKAFDAT